MRCLPSDFPPYTFTRDGPVSPQYFSLDPVRTSCGRYATIFNNRGVPLWWADARPSNIRVLPDGTILWFDLAARRFELHRLTGAWSAPSIPSDTPPITTTSSYWAAATT